MPYGEHNEPRRIWSWLRPGARRAEKQKFEAALARLARADVTDTIAEEDVRLLVATLEAGEREGN